jgi:hypothetical protein
MNEFLKKVLRLAGTVFIILFESMLHSTFELSGEPGCRSHPPLNESVWWHLKLAYWPALAYMVIEHRRLQSAAF